MVRGRMPKATNTLHKLPSDEVLQQLADLLVVPSEQREFFFKSVCANVQTTCELDGLVKQGLAIKRGKELTRAAFVLYEMLGNFKTWERAPIEGILRGKAGKVVFGRISDGGVDGLERTAYQCALVQLSDWQASPALTLPTSGPTRKGKENRLGRAMDISGIRLAPFAIDIGGRRRIHICKGTSNGHPNRGHRDAGSLLT